MATPAPEIPRPAGTTLLWIDRGSALQGQTALVDLAADLEAAGVRLWVAPLDDWSHRRGWTALGAGLHGTAKETWDTSLEEAIARADTIVLGEEVGGMMLRLVFALRTREQRIVCAAGTQSKTTTAGELATVRAWCGAADDPAITVVPAHNLLTTVAALYGADRPPLMLAEPLPAVDPGRALPYPPPPLVLASSTAPPTPQYLWQPYDGRYLGLVDRRDGRTPRVYGDDRRSGMHQAMRRTWRATALGALLAGDEATARRIWDAQLFPRQHADLRRLTLLGEEALVLVRHGAPALLARPTILTLLGEILEGDAIGYDYASERARRMARHLLLRRAAEEPALTGILSPELEAALRTEQDEWRSEIPVWQVELAAMFRGEMGRKPAWYTTARQAVEAGLMALPLPEMTAGVREAFSLDLFWVAASQRYGSLPTALAEAQRVPTLKAALNLTAVREACTQALVMLANVDAAHRESAGVLAGRGSNQRLRQIGRDALMAMDLLPADLPPQAVRWEEADVHAEADVSLPLTFQRPGRCGPVVEPQPAAPNAPVYQLDGAPPVGRALRA